MFLFAAARGVSGNVAAAAIASYVAEKGLPPPIARLFGLDCYWEPIPNEEL